jgi:hypothetical protein
MAPELPRPVDGTGAVAGAYISKAVVLSQAGLYTRPVSVRVDQVLKRITGPRSEPLLILTENVSLLPLLLITVDYNPLFGSRHLVQFPSRPF